MYGLCWNTGQHLLAKTSVCLQTTTKERMSYEAWRDVSERLCCVVWLIHIDSVHHNIYGWNCWSFKLLFRHQWLRSSTVCVNWLFLRLGCNVRHDVTVQSSRRRRDDKNKVFPHSELLQTTTVQHDCRFTNRLNNQLHLTTTLTTNHTNDVEQYTIDYLYKSMISGFQIATQRIGNSMLLLLV